MQRYGVSKDDVMTLARAAGESGIGTADIEGLTIDQAWEIISRLVSAGQLFKGRAGHRTVRYFTSQELADAWVAAGTRVANPLRRRCLVPPGCNRFIPSKRWSPDAPPHYPTNPDGSPAYKVTVCPPCRIGEGRLVRSGFRVASNWNAV